MILLLLAITIGLLFVLIGLRFIKLDRPAKVRYPWGPPPAYPDAPKDGGCKDCGTVDELDYYDRCAVCAEICEANGGVKSVPALASPLDARFREPEPPADMSGFRMERMGF